jgi:hypothetical protein
MKRLGLLVTAMVGTLVLAGCTGGDGGTDDTPSTPSPTPTASPSTDDGTGGGTPAPEPTQPADGGGGSDAEWTSGPTTVTRDLPLPPVPQLVGIRSAAHPDEGYDRIVFDVDGQLPGYTVRYMDEVREDPSDLPVAMPGRRYLLVVFTPAQAHTDDGKALIEPKRKDLDYPMMRGYVLVGDFEGYVSVAIGLDDVVGYRVGELSGRIYLDVAA